MRATVAICLLLSLLLPPTAIGGTLSRARTTIRSKSADRAKGDDREDDSDDAGKLKKVRREVRSKRPSQRGTRSRGGSYHRPLRRSHGGGAIGFFAFDRCEPCCPPPVVVETYAYEPLPVLVAPACVEPLVAESFARQFAPYPYANDCQGLMATCSPGFGKGWSGRVQFELGSDFDGLDRSGAGFLLEGAGGLGIDFDWDSCTEDLPGGGHDELHIGEFDLLYRVAESDHALVRVGLGTVWLGDRYDTDFGVNFTLKADFAPADPLILSGELDLGTLGDAQHLHAAGTVGVMLNRCELYGGYDYRRIGDVEIEGPVIGLRIWF